MIYLDNAATTYRKPDQVIEAVVAAMKHMGNAGRGAHEGALDASRMIFETRERLADLFGLGMPEQIAFTANSTQSLNIAIQGLFDAGDHVITTVLEHNSVLRPLYLMETRGIELTIAGADAKGRLDYEQVEQAIQPSTKAIVCTHASNLTGNVVDINRIGEICRKHQLLLILDASQSAGFLDIDMTKQHIDVVCFTGHKGLMAPQGIGGIAVGKGLEIRPLVVGGSGIHSYDKTHPNHMPEALEAGTLNGHAIAGLYAALGYLNEYGIEHIRNQELELMWRFYHGVRSIEGVKIYGDFDTDMRAPIVALNLSDYDSAQVADQLQLDYQIAVRAGAHCAPLMHQALGTEQQGAVRFSFSHFNTMAEVDLAVTAIKELAES